MKLINAKPSPFRRNVSIALPKKLGRRLILTSTNPHLNCIVRML